MIKKIVQNLAFIALVFFTFSCARIYHSPDASALAKKQKTIAIIKPTVSIAAGRRVDAEALKEQQKTEAVNIQKEIYSWMLRRKDQGKLDQEIQEIESSNALLQKAGYPETPLTNKELCNVLGVDGVIASNFSMSKPMSEGASIATGVLFGTWGTTNEVEASLSIHDCSAKKMIWNYNHKFSGSIGSSPARLVDGLMRQASRKMPYIK
jgi:hypothetical protein